MNKSIKIVFVFNIIITIILTTVTITTVLKKEEKQYNVQNCISTENEALEIGKIICKNANPEFDFDSDKYIWECIYNSNTETWLVMLIDKTHPFVLDGNLPSVDLKRDNGQVVRIRKNGVVYSDYDANTGKRF